jgi:hypothetical protein
MDTEEDFREMILEHCQRTGFEMPLLLIEYLTQLMATRLDGNVIIPEPSWCDSFLFSTTSRTVQGHKQFADQCLFFSSLVPEWEGLPGLTAESWAQLGSSSYHDHAELSGDLRFHQLALWFQPLQRFLASLILYHSDGVEIHDLHSIGLNIQSGIDK